MQPDQKIMPRKHVRSAVSATFRSLNHRNFRLYFIGQTISNTGNWLTLIALTLLVLHITHSGLAIGVLAACQYGPILFLSIWGGAIADRSDKRVLILITQSLEMVESIGLAILAFMPHPSVMGLYIIALMGGIVFAFDSPIRRSFVSEMVPEKDVANAVIINSTIVNLSRIIGPLLAGTLIITVGYGWCFSIDSITYIAIIISLLLMRPVELFRQPTVQKSKNEIRAGLHYVISQPVLWISFIILTIIGILSYNFNVTLPLFVTDGLHKTDTTYTIIYSTMSVGSVIAALIIAHRKVVRINQVIFGATILGCAILALAASPNVVIASIASFFVGIASILYSTSSAVLIQMQARADMRGRVLALQSILIMGTTPIGGPLLGWIADNLGGRVPLIIGGVASITAAIIGYLIYRSFHQSDTPIAVPNSIT